MIYLNTVYSDVIREAKFMARDRAVLVWVMVVLCLSSAAVWSGLIEVQQQNSTLARLVEADQRDRVSSWSQQKDWGSAAYYSFHLTYDAPSEFAFSSLGQRDSAPWKHRLRMLALEGQIYEQDAGNPALSIIGRFDFTFFSAFLLPLVLIVLLHDIKARERVAGRYNLLIVTAGNSNSLWAMRASLRSMVIFFSAIIPLVVGALISGTSYTVLLSAIGLVLIYLIFWALICFLFAAWLKPAPVILTSLVGIWVLLSTVIPAGGRMVIDRIVSLPSGAEILMSQREAVNDGWDLPKEDTMAPFLARHPEWYGYTQIEQPFEWKWYYAFQQVGDQKTEVLSMAYRGGRIERDRLAGLVAFFAPPAFFERSMQKLAETDMSATLTYEDSVRAFHADLRSFYYPGLFRDESFDKSAIERLPVFGAEEKN